MSNYIFKERMLEMVVNEELGYCLNFLKVLTSKYKKVIDKIDKLIRDEDKITKEKIELLDTRYTPEEVSAYIDYMATLAKVTYLSKKQTTISSLAKRYDRESFRDLLSRYKPKYGTLFRIKIPVFYKLLRELNYYHLDAKYNVTIKPTSNEVSSGVDSSEADSYMGREDEVTNNMIFFIVMGVIAVLIGVTFLHEIFH